MATRKISVRLPRELEQWVGTEAKRRSCDITTIILDTIRLAATAGKVSEQHQQIAALMSEIIPLFSKRFDQLENYVVQTTYTSGALAKQAGVFESAQAGFQSWKTQKGETL